MIKLIKMSNQISEHIIWISIIAAFTPASTLRILRKSIILYWKTLELKNTVEFFKFLK